MYFLNFLFASIKEMLKAHKATCKKYGVALV